MSDTIVIISRPKNSRKGKGHKGMRSAKNKASGKYTKQRAITERNRQRKALKHYLRHPNDQQAWSRIVKNKWNKL